METKNKAKVYHFASLGKLVKFDNANPETDGLNLSVTVAGPSKIKFDVFNRNTSSSVGFSFYIISFIPWVEDIILELESGKDDVEHREITSTLPTGAIQPGKSATGAFIISSDDNGPYVQLKLEREKLPKWYFKPIPGVSYIAGDNIKEYDNKANLIHWLKMLVRTVTTVSDYIAAVTANTWTPPGEDAEVVAAPPESVSKPKPNLDEPVNDDDIPF